MEFPPSAGQYLTILPGKFASFYLFVVTLEFLFNEEAHPSSL